MRVMPAPRDQVLLGDVLEQLGTLPDGCVQMVCTSPPYLNLRSYLPAGHPDKSKEIGLEQSPAEYVAKMVEVFQEVRRVLRDDGTLWLNIGDSFGPDKNLLGIPWRVAIALQDDGWTLRCDVIYSKTTMMPESVQDRPSRSHEYLFLFTKGPAYYYDATAIQEPAGDWVERDKRYQEGADEVPRSEDEPAFHAKNGKPTTGLVRKPCTTRNKRSVWTISPQSFKGAHFATMPEEMASLCVRAGSSEKGSCPACGAPWERLVERGASHYRELLGDRSWREMDAEGLKRGVIVREGEGGQTRNEKGTVPSLRAAPRRELGWRATCICPEHTPVPSLILDPFAGSGTTLAVAKLLGRDFVGVELNADYIPLIMERVRAPTQYRGERDIFEMMMDLPDE
jgi:DNA modification methylase